MVEPRGEKLSKFGQELGFCKIAQFTQFRNWYSNLITAIAVKGHFNVFDEFLA